MQGLTINKTNANQRVGSTYMTHDNMMTTSGRKGKRITPSRSRSPLNQRSATQDNIYLSTSDEGMSHQKSNIRGVPQDDGSISLYEADHLRLTRGVNTYDHRRTTPFKRSTSAKSIRSNRSKKSNRSTKGAGGHSKRLKSRNSKSRSSKGSR